MPGARPWRRRQRPAAAQRCAKGAGLDGGDRGRSTMSCAVHRTSDTLTTSLTRADASMSTFTAPRIYTCLTDATMSNGFALIMRLLPSPVGRAPRLNTTAPSVQRHYRAFNPTTGCSAPVPRISTSGLAGTAHSTISLSIRTTGSPVPCKSLIQIHAAFQPDAVWAGLQVSAQTLPGVTLASGFDIVHSVSTSHQRFAFARLSEPYLTGSCPAFSATLTTTAFNRRSLRWFEACPDGRLRGTSPHLLRSKAASRRPCYIRASSSRRRGARSSA